MASEPGISFLETFDTSCVGMDVNNEIFLTEGIMSKSLSIGLS